MGGRTRKPQELVLGSSFRLATKVETKHRLAYIDPKLRVVVIERADRSRDLDIELDVNRLLWAPRGGRLFAAGEQLHEINPDTGQARQLTKLPPDRIPRDLSCSPDGSELAFTIETIHRPGRFDDNQKWQPGISEQCLALMRLEDAKVTEHHHDPELSPRVCWMKRQALLMYKRGRKTRIAELDSGNVIEETSLPFPQTVPGACADEPCDWHEKRLETEEVRRIAANDVLPLVALNGTAVSYVLNDTELKLTDRRTLDDSVLVARTGGQRFPTMERGGLSAHISWSSDGRLLFGRLAHWSRRRRKDSEAPTRHIAPGVPSRYHYQIKRRHMFLADLITRDIAIENDRDNIHFEPMRS